MPDTKKYLDIDGLTEYHESAGHSADIADGSITTEKLAPMAVTTSKVADKAITASKLADNAVTLDKIDPNTISHIQGASIIAADSQTEQALTALHIVHRTLTPAHMLLNNEYARSTNRLCWIKDSSIETASIIFFGDLLSGQITLYAKGINSTASGKLGIDTSWTID